MLKECGGDGGLSNTTMKKDIFELHNEKFLTMCSLIPSCKYFKFYVVLIRPLSQATSYGDPRLSDILFDTYSYHANKNNNENLGDEVMWK